MTRRSWIGIHSDVTQKRQCVLASVVRGTVYAQRKPKVPDEADEVLKRLIDEEYTRHPFYGIRKMVCTWDGAATGSTANGRSA